MPDRPQRRMRTRPSSSGPAPRYVPGRRHTPAAPVAAPAEPEATEAEPQVPPQAPPKPQGKRKRKRKQKRGLTWAQFRQLCAPIKAERVFEQDGQLHVAAWDVRAHATRIFGFGGWDSEVLDLSLIYDEPTETRQKKPGHKVAWRATVQVTIRDQWGNRLCRHSATAVGDNVQAEANRGGGHDFAIKGLALDTPIPTPTGWTTMGAVQVGDQVLDRHGRPTRVTVKSPVKHLGCYVVAFRDGATITCDEEHLWVATVAQEQERVRTISELAAAKAAGKPVVIPTAGVLQLPDAELPLDPWVLGFWLGDGAAAAGRVTTSAADQSEVAAAITSAGYLLGAATVDRRNGCVTTGIRGISKVLAGLGVLGSKHVPAVYLRGSERQRRALLAGLMDSDGTVDRASGRVAFSNTNRALADAVAELARSLGERVTCSTAERRGFGVTCTSHRVAWTPTVPPFALARKVANCRPRVKVGVHRVASITPVPTVPTACIGVDAPDHTYLAGRTMVPTHNTAESQALKRCFINLAQQFGLSLYNADDPWSAVVWDSLVRPLMRRPKPRRPTEGEQQEEGQDFQGGPSVRSDDAAPAEEGGAITDTAPADAPPVDGTWWQGMVVAAFKDEEYPKGHLYHGVGKPEDRLAALWQFALASRVRINGVLVPGVPDGETGPVDALELFMGAAQLAAEGKVLPVAAADAEPQQEEGQAPAGPPAPSEPTEGQEQVPQRRQKVPTQPQAQPTEDELRAGWLAELDLAAAVKGQTTTYLSRRYRGAERKNTAAELSTDALQGLVVRLRRPLAAAMRGAGDEGAAVAYEQVVASVAIEGGARPIPEQVARNLIAQWGQEHPGDAPPQ